MRNSLQPFKPEYKMMLVLFFLFFQPLLSSTNRIHFALPPVTSVPISFYSELLELCVTLQWLCFGQIEALEAGSTSLFSTADWTTSALWSLVRDSRRNCGLHTIMSAIFHSWVSWYCGMTAATTLQPQQASLIAAENSPSAWGLGTVTFDVRMRHMNDVRAKTVY